MDKYFRKLSKLVDGTTLGVAKDFHFLRELTNYLPEGLDEIKFLDLGAGDGRSLPVAEKCLGKDRLIWTGVDIDDSEEHLGRSEGAPSVDIYDGETLPYADNSFDVVWSKQVLEHVRYPDQVISEVSRVLKYGGVFAGSVSQLEPYHSRSIFNWTHYGLITVFESHALKVEKIQPGMDGLILMLRSVFGYDTPLNDFVSRKESPLNSIIDTLFSGRNKNSDNFQAAKMKNLTIAGHIHFLSRKMERVAE